MEQFDVIVIGSGPGGYPAAIRAAQLGASVAIVEKEAWGGTCLNWGCIPTKTLIAGADLFGRIQHAESLGISVQGASADYAKMIEHKDKVVRQLSGGVKQLLTANGVKLFTGVASFKDRNMLLVNGETALGGKNIIIATGSTSAMGGAPASDPRVVDSRAFLDLKTLPARMVVVGGGFIGCELACMASVLGAKVTIVELLEDILMLLDADVRREVRASMEKNLGIRVLTGKPVDGLSNPREAVVVKTGDQSLEADVVLWAVGRKPVTDGLKLENAGLKTAERGFVEADEFCRTKVPTIFAIGDVTGKVQLAHYATSQGITAAENALRPKARAHETVVPNVIFTAPEIGTVGLSEEDAKKQNRQVKTGKFRVAGLGRGVAVGETTGFVKWVADAATDQLLGAAAVGPHATELVAEATLAIRAELTAQELGRTIHAHPTFSESWMESAHAVHGEAIHAAPRRKL
jgi:dihydrolipoamide dehydrogenase